MVLQLTKVVPRTETEPWLAVLFTKVWDFTVLCKCTLTDPMSSDEHGLQSTNIGTEKYTQKQVLTVHDYNLNVQCES